MSEQSAQKSQKSRLLIVDDHPLFREGLRQLVSHDPDLVVCGEASDATEALRLIPELKPDLVLVDISLGATSGIDLIKAIKDAYDDLPVLVISMHDESLYAERSLRAGAMGYVMKHETGKTVKNAIRKVLSGEMYLSEKMSSAIISKFMRGSDDRPASPLEILSDRELEVFRMLGQGKGTRQIAHDLDVTIATINSFRNRIKEKLHLKTATEVMLHAIQWMQGEAADRGALKGR
jgi:DNA-binding NarL/FixJ family response regulator